MNAFTRALGVLHQDQNVSREVLYRVGGNGAGVPIRVIWSEPLREQEFGETGKLAKEIRADVRLSDIAAPKKGDTIEAGGKLYEVASPQIDSENLTATVSLKAKASP